MRQGPGQGIGQTILPHNKLVIQSYRPSERFAHSHIPMTQLTVRVLSHGPNVIGSAAITGSSSSSSSSAMAVAVGGMHVGNGVRGGLVGKTRGACQSAATSCVGRSIVVLAFG